MSSVPAVLLRVRSDLRVRWRAWAFLALVIAVTGGIVLGATAGARRADTAYERFLVASHAGDMLISPQNTGTTGYYQAVAKLPGVESLAALSGMDGFSDKKQPLLLMSSLDDALGRSVERPKILDGRLPDPTRVDEAFAVGASASSMHVGDTVRVTVAPTNAEGPDMSRARTVTLRIVGTGVTRDDVVPVNALSSQGSPSKLLTTPAFRKQFDMGFNSFDGAYLRLRPGASIARVGAAASALAPKYGGTDSQGNSYGTGGAIFVADERQQAASVEQAIRPQALALALVGVLVAIVGLIVIGQLAVRQVWASADENGVLRDMGMTRRGLFAVGLIEVVAIAAAGAVLALGLSALLSPLTPIGLARIAEPDPGFSVNWLVLGLGAAAIVVLLALWVAWPLWRLSGRAVHATVAPSRPSRLAGLMRRSGSVAGSVGAGLTVQSGRGRSAVPFRTAIAGTVVAVAALAMTLTFGTNLVHLVETPALYGQTWSIGIDTGFGQIQGSTIASYLGSRSDVAGWTYGNQSDANIGGHEFPVIGLAQGKGPISWPVITDGRAPQAPDEMALGAKTMATVHAKVGDTVHVTSAADGSSRTMHIVGRAVFPLFGQGSFTPTGLGTGAAIINPVPASNGYALFLLNAKPGTSLSTTALARGLQRSGVCPADQNCPVLAQQRPVDIDNYRRVRSAPLLLAAIFALLAMATLAHLSLTTARRRRHDLAVLRTLGFVRRQVIGTVSWQATALLAVALAIGLPVGVALGRWLWTWFADRLGAAVSISVPVGWLLLVIPVALLVANLVAMGPAWRAARRPPGPALRIE
jgi:ABC-type antimicrobial peptide transport system permease subunit